MENQIVIYQTDNGQTAIDVRLENETVWLSANQMSILFDRDEKTIRKHINNVFAENELHKENNTHFLRVVGVKQPVAYYSLDVIISVGYRVKSQRGVTIAPNYFKNRIFASIHIAFNAPIAHHSSILSHHYQSHSICPIWD